MNLITIFSLYPDQEACIEHLENVRWGDDPHCPHCGGTSVARKAERHRIGRWNCRDCKSSFNVLSGTIFEKTKVELQKWFLAVALVINAKKSLSSYQLSRDLDLNQKTAWFMQQRIRAAMAADQAPMLQGIVEPTKPMSAGSRARGTVATMTAQAHRVDVEPARFRSSGPWSVAGKSPPASPTI